MNILIEKSKYKRPNPEKDREWRLKNKERLKEKLVEWKNNNPDKVLAYKIANKEKLCKRSTEWRKNNPQRANQHSINYRRKRLQEDNLFRFSQQVRTMIIKSFSRGENKLIKRIKSTDILGCTIKEFIDYILSKCPRGTQLSDFGQFGYHIDHIIPISSAKTEEDVIKLCHYTNLQPLWWKDNIQKSNKY